MAMSDVYLSPITPTLVVPWDELTAGSMDSLACDHEALEPKRHRVIDYLFEKLDGQFEKWHGYSSDGFWRKRRLMGSYEETSAACIPC